MKKAMLLASLAALCVSGNAMALLANPNLDRTVFVAGQCAGSVRILPIGSTPTAPHDPFAATFCSYLMRWAPNPNGAFPLGNALPCLLNEQSTSTSFGCFFDAQNNFSTLVFAGPGAPSPVGKSFCAGYDQFGVSDISGNITLVLGELAAPPTLGFPIGQPVPVGPPLPNLFGTACFGGVALFPVPTSISI